MTPFQMTIGSWSWLVSESTMERLGWVLLHTLWQFLSIAVLALILLRVLSRSSAGLRYAILVCSIAGCVVAPVVTWFSLQVDSVRVATVIQTNAIEPVPIESMPSQLGSSNEPRIASDGPGVAEDLAAVNEQSLVEGSQFVAESSNWWMNARDDLRPWLMTIVTVWILGVMICAVRPLLSWFAIGRWRRVGTSPVSQEVTAMMHRVSERLGVRRKVEILKSQLVHAPLVFGYLRPVILLPASLLTNLPTTQLEAIIAHELAHVRRHDFLVNFIQTIIETLFFYHPAIWWLSHQVRIERENCCDDLVVSVLCNRVEYGKALLAVEESPGLARSLALGARDGSLLARVQRLAGLEAARRGPIASVAAMIASTLLIAGTAFMIGNLLLAASDDNETQFGKESNGLQIRLIPLAPEVSDESPELQRTASSFKRSEEMTFAVQIKNVSRQPISLAGIRYGDGYAAETKGKLNTAMLAPHWFEFEFTDSEGKRMPRTPQREFYKGWYSADNCSVHVLAPGESLSEVLRPAKFMEPMNYDLAQGKYRVQVHYRGPNDSLREFVRKHWPDKPILNAWPHQATSNVSDFAIEEASNSTKPEELIWGEPVEGLQAALEYRLPDDAKGNPLNAPGIAVGTPLGITFHLRNVSDKPITFVSETGRQGDWVHVTDALGKEVEVKSVFYTGWPIDVAWKLMPGEVAQLRLLTPSLGSLDKPGQYKVRYTIRFNSRGQKDEAGNVIFPRPGDYDREVDTGETPLFLHEAIKDVSANNQNPSEEPVTPGVLDDDINSTDTSNPSQPSKSENTNDQSAKVETDNSAKTNRVIDARGNPVAGAKIDCLPSMKYSWLEVPKSLGSTVTDSDGWFEYPDGLPAKDTFYVYVSSDGFLERVFQANNGEAYVLENGIRKPDTLVLRRPITVSGKIIGIDGKPLADAEIAVDYMYENGWAQINGNRVKSDAEGRFVATGIEPANVFVRYETPYQTDKERIPTGTQPGKLCIVSFTATDGQVKDDIFLDLSKCNYVVEGRIVDHEDKGVPNRWIQATFAGAKGRLDESITVNSDAEGRFRFEGLTNDEFEIGTYTPGIRETFKPSLDKPPFVRLTTYVQGKEALANDPNPPIYGEPSESGIVGGIRVRDGAKHKLGDSFNIDVLIKNNTDQVKMVAYSFAEHANLRAFDGDKSIAELNYSHFTGITVTTHYRLAPNQEVVVGSFNCGLHDPDDKQNGLPKSTFKIPCRVGQPLTLRCQLRENLFGRSSGDGGSELSHLKDMPLSTGTLTLNVLPTKELAQTVLESDKALAKNSEVEERVLAILRTPFIEDPEKGTWQLGAHDIDVHWKLRDLPKRVEVIKTLFKVIDRSVPSSMHERLLAMEFLGGADPKNLVPRLNKEIENALANPAKPFTAYHEIEILGRMGEHARSSLPVLIKLLDSNDGAAYDAAVNALIIIGARSTDVMNELAKHTDDPVTVSQLGRYGPMAKVHGPLFGRLLDSPSNEIHNYAALALVKTGFDEARGYDVLIADVAAGKSVDRCRAATALAALGSQAKEMIPRLRPFENDPDPQVAKAVREAIVRIEKDDRIFTHAEVAAKREKALEAFAALNPQMQFDLRIVGGEEQTPIAEIEIIATEGYGDSQKTFGPFRTDATGTTVCKLPQGFYTLHLKSEKEFPFLPYEKFWTELPPPGMQWLNLRVTGIDVEKWLGGEVRESGVEPAKSSAERTRITFKLLKPIELVLRAVDKETGLGLPGAYFYLESAAAEEWAHPIDGANLGEAHYRDGVHAIDSSKYQTGADGTFKRFISDGYLRRSGDSEWGPKFGVWKAPEGYEVVEPKGEVSIDFPAPYRSAVEKVFNFRQVK
ncbi:MAG: M56 family metallopeptidase [Pirellulales bacterium]